MSNSQQNCCIRENYQILRDNHCIKITFILFLNNLLNVQICMLIGSRGNKNEQKENSKSNFPGCSALYYNLPV